MLNSHALAMLDRRAARVWPYVQLARVDHWFKNVFMGLGTVVAFSYRPDLFTPTHLSLLALALVAACLIASSNYVLNELIDGPRDRLHPDKRSRPVPAGRIRMPIGYAQWILLAIAGLYLAWLVNRPFALTAAGFWLMGVVYNVPPIRTKEWPYIDVLSESANNVIRLLLGWFPLIPDQPPPLSLALSYWMLGGFFMATKRFAEYRQFGTSPAAALYRRSFQYYTEERLLSQHPLLCVRLLALRWHVHRLVPSGACVLRSRRCGSVRLLSEDRASTGKPSTTS